MNTGDAGSLRHGLDWAGTPVRSILGRLLDESLRPRVAALIDDDGLVKESHEHWRHW